MSQRTVLNENYKGLVESMSIPVHLHERDGKKFASFGSVIPIHCCTPEEVSQRSQSTHHYCGVFSDQLMAPMDELVFVRIDENTAEKVFVNRSKRLLLLSSDGALAQWRCAASFESANRYLAGTPIVNKDGQLVSVVTAKRGNHYAVSSFEGDGGYFTTSLPWKVLETPPEGTSIYGEKTFSSREELRAYIAALPPLEVKSGHPSLPILYQAPVPRIVLVAQNERQISHQYLHGVIASGIDYL